MNKQPLIHQIKTTFDKVLPPPSWDIVNSNVGDEPFDITNDFKDKTDIYAIDTEFLDQSPKGLASALSFFSSRAFHFYIPAYMIADIEGKLQRTNVLFHLINGFTNTYKTQLIGGYGSRTWFDYFQYTMSVLYTEQKQAIINYLNYKFETTDSDFEKEQITEAKINYWNEN
jgi:hypothetical protein